MTKDEAITSMETGNKVTHRHFISKEYITMEDGMVVDESGYKFKPIIFWAYRTHPNFESGWSLYK